MHLINERSLEITWKCLQVNGFVNPRVVPHVQTIYYFLWLFNYLWKTRPSVSGNELKNPAEHSRSF